MRNTRSGRNSERPRSRCKQQTASPSFRQEAASDPRVCCRQEGSTARLSLELPQGEAADYLNFVVKDSATNRWYDSHGQNFHVPLRLALSSMAEIPIDEEVLLLAASLGVLC